MQGGQASSELLLVLAAVLIVGLIVIGILVFYAGTSEDTLGTQSALYWRNAKPIAIREVWAGNAQADAYDHQSAVLLVLKNVDKERLVIKSINISNSASANAWTFVKWGDTVSYDNYGKPVVSPNTCSAGDNRNAACSIPLNPGEVVKVLVWTTGTEQCGTSGELTEEHSINSIRKSIRAPVFIIYERMGIPVVESGGAVKLFARCQDYFACHSNADCVARYNVGFFCGSSGNCYFAE